jgi:tetratricopeptide (TPR) repeat protein
LGAISGDKAIAACTRAIDSGRSKGHELAVLYNYRAVEYGKKHEYDRAIADLTEAVRLDPKS